MDDNNLPNLIRTSSLDPEFIRNNLSLVNTPVKLLFEKDTKEMTENWTEEEMQDQRRLVKFEFVRISFSDYLVKFKPIPKSEFTNNAAIISCIFWKEKELHIVTSVDIILLLEYLIQQSFSIEEKNRIRRNLQSLKPSTISRTNKNYNRFFLLLMSMEDPRPRNIEKDLKVFKWSDLFNALNKVISKYSSNNIMPIQLSMIPQQFVQSQPQYHHQPQGPNNQPQINPYYQYPQNTQLTSDINKLPQFGVNNSNVVTVESTNVPSSDRTSDTSSNNEGFLPYERLKVMKKKQSGPPQYQTSSLNNKHKAYQNGIAPADPVPMNISEDGTIINKMTGSTKFSNNEVPPTNQTKETNSNPTVLQNQNQTAMYQSESSSTSEESGSGYGVTSSDEQLEEKKSQSQSVSDEYPEEVNTKSRSSLANNFHPESAYSGTTKPVGLSMTRNSGSGASGDSNDNSGTNSGGDSIFTKPKSSNTGISSVENEKTEKNGNSYQTTNNFAQDQSDRIFGSKTQKEQPYYQYPDGSQIQYTPVNNPLPPISSIASNTSSVNSANLTSHKLDVRLPSLEEYFSSSNSNPKSVQLPPLMKKKE